MKNNGYSGIDVLDAMANAKNYNTHLANLVIYKQKKGSQLVDFGAGSGTFALMLLGKGFEVRCIEPDLTLAGQLGCSGLSVSESIQNFSDIEFLYSLNVLEHIKDDSATVFEIYSHMKDGGGIFIYVPAFMCLFTKFDKRIGHFRRYSKKQIVGLLKQAGFVVDEARYVDSLGFLVTLIFKWFGNSRGEISLTALKFYDTVLFPMSRFCDVLLSPFFGKNVMVRAHKGKSIEG